MLFGPVLKELQAPQGIPTLDREHSHKAGNNYIFIEVGIRLDIDKHAGGP